MARCAHCGNHTSWLRRARVDDQEFCGYACLLDHLGADVDLILEAARQGVTGAAYKLAAEAYLRALAIGIPSPRESAFAKWEYASVLWRLGGGPTLDAIFERSREPDLPADVHHYLSEAESDLKRHLRSMRDDLGALRLLHKISFLLKKPTTAVEEQIKRLEIRQSLLQSGDAPSSAEDRTGASFEARSLQLVRAMGFHAELTKATGDGGIDIIAFQEQPLLRGKYVIQCKDWTNPVGEPVLRDLLGVVTAEDAVKGILITSGSFTDGARRFAEGRRLDLIDGRDLEDLCAKYGVEP